MYWNWIILTQYYIMYLRIVYDQTILLYIFTSALSSLYKKKTFLWIQKIQKGGGGSCQNSIQSMVELYWDLVWEICKNGQDISCCLWDTCVWSWLILGCLGDINRAIVLSSSATCRYDWGGGQYKKIMEYIYCSLRNWNVCAKKRENFFKLSFIFSDWPFNLYDKHGRMY